MTKRQTTRAYRKLKADFFEQGKHQANNPQANCWICKQPINYTLPPGSHDTAHELDHYYPVSTHPHLQHDPANFRHSHRKCNRQRSNGQPNLTIGETIPRWW